MSRGGSGAVSVDLWLPLFRSTGGSLGYRGSKNLLVFLHTAPLEHSLPLSQPRLKWIPGCRIVDLGSRQIHHNFKGRGFPITLRTRRRITTQNGMKKKHVAAKCRAKLCLHFQINGAVTW